jgi:hypothetical protein
MAKLLAKSSNPEMKKAKRQLCSENMLMADG